MITIKRKFKRILSFGLMLAMSLMLYSCKAETKEEEETIDISVSELAKYVKDNIVFKDDLQAVDPEMLENFYSMDDPEFVSDFCVYVSASGATAEEIAVFKLSNEMYADDIKKVIKERQESQVSSFENYIPEEVLKINNGVVIEKDGIITFVVSNTPDDVENVIEKFYNNQ